MQSLLEREANAYWRAAQRVRLNSGSQAELDDAMDDLSLIALYSTSETIRRDYSRLQDRLCVSSA